MNTQIHYRVLGIDEDGTTHEDDLVSVASIARKTANILVAHENHPAAVVLECHYSLPEFELQQAEPVYAVGNPRLIAEHNESLKVNGGAA